MKRNDETVSYAQMGMAAMLPGMVRMVELMQTQVDELRAQLGQMQPPKKKMGRPSKADLEQRAAADAGQLARSPRANGAASGWPADPEARRAEMRRRMQVAAAKNGQSLVKARFQPNHPRNVDHPDHAKWVAKMKKGRKKAWAAMTEAQQKEQVQKMVAGQQRFREAS